MGASRTSRSMRRCRLRCRPISANAGTGTSTSSRLPPREAERQESIPFDLQGLRVLVVEDAALVGMLLESALEDAGCVVVGPAGSVQDALREVSDGGFDVALLDVNLHGEFVFPVADALQANDVPFGCGRASQRPRGLTADWQAPAAALSLHRVEGSPPAGCPDGAAAIPGHGFAGVQSIGYAPLNVPSNMKDRRTSEGSGAGLTSV